jgi:integrase
VHPRSLYPPWSRTLREPDDKFPLLSIVHVGKDIIGVHRYLKHGGIGEPPLPVCEPSRPGNVAGPGQAAHTTRRPFARHAARRRWKSTGGRCPACGAYYRQRSVSTVNRELMLAKAVLRKAIRLGWLKENPITKEHFYKEPRPLKRFLTEDEAGRLLAACDADFRSVVLLALHSGCRANELRTLTWANVDMGARRITIASGYAKNSEERSICMSPDVYQALSQMRQDREVRPDHPVLRRREGQPWKSWESAWKNALKRSGIAHCRFHDLRHTCCSWLAMRGVDLVERARMLGHDTAMQARYTHLSDDYQRAAVANLPGLGQSGTESPHISHEAEEAKVVGFRK